MADGRTGSGRPVEQVRNTARQQEFQDAENGNVLEQAGASLGEGRAPTPTPGDRLTGKHAEREIGRETGSSLSRAEREEMQARKTAVESDALREGYSGAAGADTDSDLEAEKTRVRVEGLIGNPD